MSSLTVPLAAMRKHRPCPEQFAIAEELYPDGIPLTFEAAKAIRERGGDVVWGLCHLSSPELRREFILFTLRQRQPYVVALLRKAGEDDHAAKIAGLTFATFEDAHRAVPILWAAVWATAAAAADAGRDAVWAAWAAARDAAWAAARDAGRDAAWAAWAAAADAGRDAVWATAADAADAGRDAVWATAGRDEQIDWLLPKVRAEWLKNGKAPR